MILRSLRGGDGDDGGGGDKDGGGGRGGGFLYPKSPVGLYWDGSIQHI